MSFYGAFLWGPWGLWLRVRNCALRGGSAPWRTIAAWVLGSLAPFAPGGCRLIGHDTRVAVVLVFFDGCTYLTHCSHVFDSSAGLTVVIAVLLLPWLLAGVVAVIEMRFDRTQGRRNVALPLWPLVHGGIRSLWLGC